MAEHKLDIFAALAACDLRDGGWLERQSEDARKGFAPPVFLRWASAMAGDGVAAEYTLAMLNERVNVGANQIMSQHPDLLFRLAASCGVGRRSRHEWLPMSGRRVASDKARDLLARYHPSANDQELDLLMSLHTRESFKDFVSVIGLSPEESKEAVKAHDRVARNTAGGEAAPKAPAGKKRKANG